MTTQTQTADFAALVPETFDFAERAIVDILNVDSLPKKLREQYSDEERAQIAALFESGKITREARVVRISAQTAGTEEDQLWPFYAYIPAGQKEAVVMSNNMARPRPWDSFDESEREKLTEAQRKIAQTWGLVDYWAYGYYLQFTQPIRLMLSEKAGGPEKEIQKQVKLHMKSGLFDTEEEAREAVLAQRARRAAKAAQTQPTA